MFRISTFENLIDKATSNMLLEPDWNAIMQICDMIRQKDITPKTAIQTIKRRMNSCNPNVVLYTLQVLESVVKNCGINVHKEVATKEFMLDLKDVLKESNNEPIKQKILELIQIWSHAFRNEPNYHIVKDTYVLLKMEGYNFPMLKESDAMFTTENPPDWIDGEECHSCKTTFTLVQRKHHCRCCGQVFCQKCSSKVSIIPKFGIEREVRVCDECYDQNNGLHSETAKTKQTSAATKGYEKYFDPPSDINSDEQLYDAIYKMSDKESLPFEYLNSPLSKQSQEPLQKTEQEEKEEMELALALSASEAEANLAKAAKATKYSYLGVGLSNQPHTKPVPTIDNVHVGMMGINSSVEADMENELARYLDRSFWENKKKQLTTTSKNSTLPSAPDAGILAPSSPDPYVTQPLNVQSQGSGLTPQFGGCNDKIVQEKLQDTQKDILDNGADLEEFVSALRNGINIFVKRMQSNASRGRPITNDSSVQTLFITLSHLQPKLMEQIKVQEDKRNHFETLQDKISQIKDARAALISLREEFNENEKREAEEIERQRKFQISQKLAYMRQKKQEYMDYQRQITLQRLAQEQYAQFGNRDGGMALNYNALPGMNPQANMPYGWAPAPNNPQPQFIGTGHDVPNPGDHHPNPYQPMPVQQQYQYESKNDNNPPYANTMGKLPEHYNHQFFPQNQSSQSSQYVANTYSGQNFVPPNPGPPQNTTYNMREMNQALKPNNVLQLDPSSILDKQVTNDDGPKVEREEAQKEELKKISSPELISFD